MRFSSLSGEASQRGAEASPGVVTYPDAPQALSHSPRATQASFGAVTVSLGFYTSISIAIVRPVHTR